MRFEAAVSEDRRQVVHVLMGAFALLLPYIPWWQAVALAATAVLFNLFALQRVMGLAVFRPGERLGRLTSGIVLYPIAILALLLIFPSRPDIVGGSWGVLAAGDGMATIVGRRVPIAQVPWNPRKSVGGSLAFVLFGGLAAWGLAWWCQPGVVPPAYPWYPAVAGFAGAFVAAAVETIPIRLDDNISTTAASAATFWIISLISEDALASAMSERALLAPVALFVNALVAAVGHRTRTVTVAGAVCGAIIGTIVLVCTGWPGWGLLLTTFACAVVSSRLGWRRKTLMGIAEDRGGRRGAGNAIANTGVAAIAAVCSVLTYANEAALVAFVAALAAGGSDTIASEIGKAWGKRTYLVTTWARVRPGTPGAMSIEGTTAGLAGACLLGLVGVGGGLIDAGALVPVVAGATLGSLFESVLGATLEPRGVVNNDLLNFLNTAAAAGVALTLLGSL